MSTCMQRTTLSDSPPRSGSRVTCDEAPGHAVEQPSTEPSTESSAESSRGVINGAINGAINGVIVTLPRLIK